jgi:signal transduction histidine kinase
MAELHPSAHAAEPTTLDHDLAAGPVAVACVSAAVGALGASVAWASGVGALSGWVPVILGGSAAIQLSCVALSRRHPQVGGQVSSALWLPSVVALMVATPFVPALALGALGLMFTLVMGSLTAPPGAWWWGPLTSVAWWLGLGLCGLSGPAGDAVPLLLFPAVIFTGTAVLLAGITARLHHNERALHAAMAALVTRSDEAVRADRAKSEFLASMSHELRTPLNAIIGYGDLILEGDAAGPDVRVDVDRITRAGRHLLALVNDVLDMARIESGRLELRAEPFSPAALLRDLRTVVEPLAAAGRDVLVWDVDGLPEVVMGDELRVRQVLLNLLGNACKFTSDGTVTLRATGSDGMWSVVVSDDGPGIDAETQSQLFVPFTQGRQRGLRAQGTGLGLAITRELVLRMGGTVGFQRTPGPGATFEVRLPS